MQKTFLTKGHNSTRLKMFGLCPLHSAVSATVVFCYHEKLAISHDDVQLNIFWCRSRIRTK